jgi:type IV pilus assembly protein PilQ
MKAAIVVLAFVGVLAAPPGARGQDPKAPAQPAPQAGQPVQEDPAARVIRETYEERIRRERQLVTIKARGVRVEQVVEDFRRESGVNIVVDTRNFPENFAVDEFIVENEPFRKALEAFASKMELAIEEVSPTLLRLSRPPRVSVNFREADVKSVIDVISRVSGANIIVAPEVKGSITLSVKDVPWYAVLEYVVKTLSFTTVREEFGVIRVIHPDELLKQMDTRWFRLKYITPPPVYEAKVEANKQIAGKELQPPQEIDQLLKRFVLKQVLETALSKNAAGKVIGALEFDPPTNTFIVKDTKVVLDRVAAIIQALDVEPEQVHLDLSFISTTNEDLMKFGTSWSFVGEPGAGIRSIPIHPGSVVDPNDPATIVDTGKVTRLPFGFGSEVPAGKQFFLTQFDVDVIVRAVKKDRFSRVVQKPTLTVMDNVASTIFLGETVPYAETSAVSNDQGDLTFSIKEGTKSPVKVGFQLFVIPKVVRENNQVILTIIPQNEFLSGRGVGPGLVPGFERFTIKGGPSGELSIDLPRVSTTTIYTKMNVESGRTAVLGGLVVERTTFEDTGIPILKDIPIVNFFFKQRNDSVVKEHLLIFVTPRIVRTGRGTADHLKEQLRMREERELREYEERKKKAAGQPK